MKMRIEIAICTAVLFVAVSAPAAPVTDTGQTVCYDNSGNILFPSCPSSGQPYYGQDACYSINPMSYTKLNSSGNALPSSATSWTTVKDNVTGLIWEVKTSMNNGQNQNFSDPHNGDNTYTWYDSNPATNGGNAGTPDNGTDNTEAFLKALNNAHYGGYSDWRLPTITELASIVNYGTVYSPLTYSPAISAGYFPNTQYNSLQTSNYWTSTTCAGNVAKAWTMDFVFGKNYTYNKNIYGIYARAVRGTITGTTVYTNNGDGTVTDNTTGLMWQQGTARNYMTWENALSYCENLNLAGYTNWRMPTIKELISLVNFSNASSGPMINQTYFPNTAATIYWTSTTKANASDTAWDMDFSDGINNDCYKTSETYVRAVRMGQEPLTQTACTANLDGNLALHIPYITYHDTNSGTLSLAADLVYDPNPAYPTLILFKYAGSSNVNSRSFPCIPSTLSSNLAVHIPDLARR